LDEVEKRLKDRKRRNRRDKVREKELG